MKVALHMAHRAEEALIYPVKDALEKAGMLGDDGHGPVLIPGDRIEAMRKAVEMFAAGRSILHLGAGDACEGDDFHHDGAFRALISELAIRSGGLCMGLREITVEPKDSWVVVGPPQIEVPEKLPRELIPEKVRDADGYNLLCWNPLPDGWGLEEEIPERPKGQARAFAMHPGDGAAAWLPKIAAKGWLPLEPLPRHKFLAVLKYAKRVFGNSSLLTYEAPAFHPDEAIRATGHRNRGRGIVRWDIEKQGRPSENVVKAIQAWGGK